MPMCQPGVEVPEQGIVTTVLLAEEPWGELWRATHERHGSVFFVAYTTATGMEMFEESLDTLKRWKVSSPASEPMLEVLEISADSAVPYLVVQDPGGETIREVVADELNPVDPLELVRWFRALMEGIQQCWNVNIQVLNITPDTLVLNPHKPNSPLRIIPICPGNHEKAALLAGGRFTAPELPGSPTPKLIGSESYSTGWILTEALLGRWDVPRHVEDVREQLPAPKLVQVLTAALFSRGGAYAEPPVMEAALKRYIRSDAEADLKKLRKAQQRMSKEAVKKLKKEGKSSDNLELSAATTTRSSRANVPVPPLVGPAAGPASGVQKRPGSAAGPKKKKKKKNSPKKLLQLIGTVLIFLAVGAGVTGGLIYYVHDPVPVQASPLMASQEFFDALVAGRSGTIQGLVAESARPSAQALLEVLDGRADSYSDLTVRTESDTTRTGAATIRGRNSETLMFVSANMTEQEGGSWVVTGVNWEEP